MHDQPIQLDAGFDKMPHLSVSSWLHSIDSRVVSGEPIVIIDDGSTQRVVTAPCTGRIVDIYTEVGAHVLPRTVLGMVRPDLVMPEPTQGLGSIILGILMIGLALIAIPIVTNVSPVSMPSLPSMPSLTENDTTQSSNQQTNQADEPSMDSPMPDAPLPGVSPNDDMSNSDAATDPNMIEGMPDTSEDPNQSLAPAPSEPNADPNNSNIDSNDPNAVTNDSNVDSNDPNAVTNDSNVDSNDPNAVTNDSNVDSNDPNTVTNDSNVDSNDSNADTNTPSVEINNPNVDSNDPNAITKTPTAVTNDSSQPSDNDSDTTQPTPDITPTQEEQSASGFMSNIEITERFMFDVDRILTLTEEVERNLPSGVFSQSEYDEIVSSASNEVTQLVDTLTQIINKNRDNTDINEENRRWFSSFIDAKDDCLTVYVTIKQSVQSQQPIPDLTSSFNGCYVLIDNFQ